MFKDYRINEIINEAIIQALHDNELKDRIYLNVEEGYNFKMGDLDVLVKDVNNILYFVDTNCNNQVRINVNIWDIFRAALEDILDLYGLDYVKNDKYGEQSLLIRKEVK